MLADAHLQRWESTLDKSTQRKVKMQIKKKSPVTIEQPLGSLAGMTIGNLEQCYLTLNPGMESADFKKDFVAPILDCDVATGDNILEKMNERYKEMQENGTPECFKNGPMLLSTAYCLQASKQLNLNNREYAWAYMVQAKFWHGVVSAALGIEIARTKTIHATRRKTALMGAASRDQTYAVTRQEAFRLARELVPGGGQWRSANHAAEKIKDRVLAFASTHGTALIAKYPEKTIAEWLGLMPDAAELFKTFKTKKAKEISR